MRKIILLAVLCCFCLPAFAVQDDGQQSVNLNYAVTQPSANRAPGSLTTLFASNNGFAGNSFDIEPAVAINEITAVDVNWSTAGQNITVSLYYKEGTANGFETNPGVWTKFASGSGLTAAQDQPTFIDLAGNGQMFEAGKLYGILLFCDSYGTATGSIRYTNGGPNNYANSELSLTTYAGLASPLHSSVFPGRIWNGTVYYDFGDPLALTVSPKEVSAWFGGTLTFKLNGGVDLANRSYLLLGSTSGTLPGTVLPGGLVIELNYDWYTDLLLSMALAGGYGVVNDFIGVLDADGAATATLTFPGKCELFEDVDTYYAWCTYGPFDFASNSVTATVLGAPSAPDAYVYDDGTSENALGWSAGGAAVWTHGFDSGIGDDIEEISSTFGSAGASTGPANGTACELYVWSDPDQNGDPADAGLLGTVNGVVANTNTNTFNHYTLGAPVAVVGKFFVGCYVETLAGTFAAPMDQTSYAGHSFFMGAYTGSGLTWDPSAPGASAIYEMGAIGYPANWLLRANDN